MTAVDLNNLAVLYHDQGKYEKAEALYQRSLAIDERHLGRENRSLSFATLLSNLAELYLDQRNYQQAELFYQRAWQIQKQVLGTQHSTTVKTGQRYNALLQAIDRQEEIDLPEIPQPHQVKAEQRREADQEK